MLNPEAGERLADLRATLDTALPILTGHADGEQLQAFRQAHDRQLARLRPPPGISFDDVDMGGVRALAVTPGRVRDERAMIYLHGGGYFSGGPLGYRGLVGHYAELLGARVYVPDYRLAPEHRFPAALDDVVATYRWLVRRADGATRVALAGDSAGGAMVISAMVRARTAGMPLPVGGVAISPWANLEMTGASYSNRNGLDPFNSHEALVPMARLALGDELPGNPEASPVFADVRGLPPIMVQVGENEVMLTDAMRLATHLGEHRVHTLLEVWPGMFHVWHLLADVLPEGRAAVESGARFLERVFVDAVPHDALSGGTEC